MEAALYALLTGDAGLSAIVGTKIWWDVRGQNTGFPSIVMTKVSGPRGYDMQGPDGTAVARIQFDCDATTKIGVDALRDALRNCLSGYRGTVSGVQIQGAFLESERTEFDSSQTAQNIFRHSLDFSITYKEI